jgi:hypothetical protein
MILLRRIRPAVITMLLALLTGYLFIFTPAPASAFWPFPPKRFSKNALLGAGSLGVEGRVVAFGDFNGDQLYVVMRSGCMSRFTLNSLDLMTLASDQRTLSVYIWNHGALYAWICQTMQELTAVRRVVHIPTLHHLRSSRTRIQRRPGRFHARRHPGRSHHVKELVLLPTLLNLILGDPWWRIQCVHISSTARW